MNQGGDIVNLQFLHQRFPVRANGLYCKIQSHGDLFAGSALGKESQNLDLSFEEAFEEPVFFAAAAPPQRRLRIDAKWLTAMHVYRAEGAHTWPDVIIQAARRC